MTDRAVLVSIEGGVVTMRLNRPQSLNALSAEVIDELLFQLDEITARGDVRVLLLAGTRRAFSSGASLTDNVAMDSEFDAGRILETHYNPLMVKLAELPFPIIAAVSGPAAGAGCSLALAADFVFAAKSAYFLLAFVNIGLVPDSGITWRLPRAIGAARASAMMMLGERLDAPTAEAWGLIHRCVDDERMETEANAMAERLARGPTRAYALIRSGLRACMQLDFAPSLEIERNNQRQAGRTNDFIEGVSSFLTRKPASFTGR